MLRALCFRPTTVHRLKGFAFSAGATSVRLAASPFSSAAAGASRSARRSAARSRASVSAAASTAVAAPATLEEDNSPGHPGELTSTSEELETSREADRLFQELSSSTSAYLSLHQYPAVLPAPLLSSPLGGEPLADDATATATAVQQKRGTRGTSDAKAGSGGGRTMMTKARRARLAAAVALAEKHLSEDNTPGAAFLHSQRVQELRAEEALLSASLKRLEAERSLATARHQCETELQTFRAGVAAREKAVAQMIAAGRAAKQQGRQPANASERPVLTLMECSELALDDEEALETREEGVTRERKRSVAVSSAAASETASEESDSGSCNNSISNRGAVDRGGLGSSSSSSSSSSITPSSRSMGTAAAASHSITTSSPLEPQPLGLSATYDADEAVLLTSPASPPVARRRARPTASKQQHPRRSKNRKRRSASVSASGGRERRRNKGVGAATSTTMMSHRRSSAQRKRRATAPKSSSTLAKRLSPQRLQQQQQQQRRRRGGGGGGKKLLGRLRHRLRARSSSNTVTQGARIKKTHSAKTKKSRPKAIASGSRRGMTRMSTKRLASHTTSKRLLQRIKTQLSRYSNQNAVEVLKRTRKSAWRRSLANGTPRRR